SGPLAGLRRGPPAPDDARADDAPAVQGGRGMRWARVGDPRFTGPPVSLIHTPGGSVRHVILSAAKDPSSLAQVSVRDERSFGVPQDDGRDEVEAYRAWSQFQSLRAPASSRRSA